MLSKKQSPGSISRQNTNEADIPAAISPNVEGFRKALDQLAQDVAALNGSITIKVETARLQARNSPIIREILLSQNLLTSAGFTGNNPVKVISMDRILIIIPQSAIFTTACPPK